MTKRSLAIRRLVSGGIITNYDCTSSCAHCLYNCGPHRGGDYMEESTASEVAEVIQKHGGGSVHIGGGEPFSRPDRLAAVLQAVHDRGVSVEYVETNSS